MTDVFTVEKRSEVMARIRGRGNKATEIALVIAFRKSGIIGWRRHYRVFGRPDFAFPSKKVAIFVDGCFWHGCPKHCSLPVSNREFWRRKLGRNKTRDRLVAKTLRKRGWTVVRIWEHDLAARNLVRTVSRIHRVLED
ncbi:very short patch repair endonuclease [Opitutus sp. ER46]|uniref:very short patch repair endonuclease n=1 Tax=Opitutus sp. ER46 TaxID=2161864 RepID=UPI000D31304C|nr:very short patch repair endonuclease [Opitutus sp. ER46]